MVAKAMVSVTRLGVEVLCPSRVCWGGGVAGYHFRLCPLSRYLVFGQLIGGAVDPSIAPIQVEWQFSGGYVALGRRVIASVRDVNSCLVACLV